MVVKRKRDLVCSKTLKADEPKVHPLGTTLADLPYDIVTNILLKLPIKSVLICMCVCKSWRSIMSDPHFAQLYSECAPMIALVRTSDSRCVSRTLHLLDFDEFKSNETQNFPSDNDCGHVCSCKDYPRHNCDNHMKLEVKLKLPLRDSKMVIDTKLESRRMGKKRTNIACKPQDDKFDVVNSCNGLLCLCNPVKIDPWRVVSNPMTLAVCNPITGEFIRLPQSENDKLMTHCSSYGFGYLKGTNEYKVIKIYSKYNPRLLTNAVDIHTLGTGLWRTIEYRGPYWMGYRSAICLNGSVHWLVYTDTGVSILCFDLESETFNSFPCPSALSSMRNLLYCGFGEFKGNLYIWSCSYANAKCLRFWTMKTYGVVQSINLNANANAKFILSSVENNKKLIVQNLRSSVLNNPGTFLFVPIYLYVLFKNLFDRLQTCLKGIHPKDLVKRVALLT